MSRLAHLFSLETVSPGFQAPYSSVVSVPKIYTESINAFRDRRGRCMEVKYHLGSNMDALA